MENLNDGCRQDQGFGGHAANYAAISGTVGHPGIDRTCGYASPIYSPVAGVVYALFTPERPATDGYTGIYILCRTGLERFEFTVGHVSKITVSIGQRVSKGDLLGYEGNKGAVFVGGRQITLAMQAAGNRSGSHRHYQKRVVTAVARLGNVPCLTTSRGVYRDIAGLYLQWALPTNGYRSCVDFTQPLFVSQLSRGSSGYQVLLLQRALGIPAPTGFFGPATQAALIQFQRAEGIDAVGTVGPRTRSLLNARYGQLEDGGATGGADEVGDNPEGAPEPSYYEGMEYRKYGALSSSIDPEKLAATVNGLIKIVAGGLVYLGVASQMDAATLVGNVTQLISLGFTAWGLLESVFGIARKIAVALALVR